MPSAVVAISKKSPSAIVAIRIARGLSIGGGREPSCSSLSPEMRQTCMISFSLAAKAASISLTASSVAF